MMQDILVVIMLAGVLGGILFGLPVMLVLVVVPLVASLVGSGLGVFDFSILGAMSARIFGIADNPLLQSVPLFILVGKMLECSGMANSLFAIRFATTNRSNSSLIIGVVGTGILIAASSGIVGASIAVLGAIAVPALSRGGIGQSQSSGLVCATGTLGQLIPPSIVLILLSDQVSNAFLVSQRAEGIFDGESVTLADVFAGAIIPGLLLAVAYGAYAVANAKEANISEQHSGSEPEETSSTIMGLSCAGVLLLVPVSIVAGLASVTEAGIFGVAATLLIALAFKRTTGLVEAVREAVLITGVIFGIIIAASFFSLVLRGFEGDLLVKTVLGKVGESPQVALIAVMLAVFVLGFVMEFIEITYVVVPIIAPALFALGVDPVWFAVLMAVNLQMSFLTPPMGVALFYYKAVQSIETMILFRSVAPYVIIQFLMLVLLLLFPALATWLPELLV